MQTVTTVEDSTSRELVKPEAMPVSVLSQMESAHIDKQIQTAKAYPRDLQRFKAQALAMATIDEDTAAGCFYTLKRRGKSGDSFIIGPSVRLAEIVASTWHNLRVSSRVVSIDGTHVTAQALCHDLETNVAIAWETKRSIVGNYGRYNEDMITTTGNAAAAIAFRNSVFKVVPAALVQSIFKAARQVAQGDVKSLAERRQGVLAHFGKMGVEPERVCWTVGVESVEEIDLEALEVLRGLATAIKDGDTDVDSAFPPTQAQADGKSKAETLAANLRDRKAKDKPAEIEPSAKTETKSSKPADSLLPEDKPLPTTEPTKSKAKATV